MDVIQISNIHNNTCKVLSFKKCHLKKYHGDTKYRMIPNTISSVVNIVLPTTKFILKGLQLATRDSLVEKGPTLVGCVVL